MTLLQLKYFEAVCSLGSFTNAAAHLHISQPSLSSAIKELENEFGVCLFKRHHKGASLTSEGELFRKMSADILGRTADAESIMKDLGVGKKSLKLGVPPMIGSLILPKIYNGFLPDNPNITLEITESGRSNLMQKLSDGYLDLAFLPHEGPFDSDLCSVFLKKLQIFCCTHKASHIAKLSNAEPNALDEVPMVLFHDSFLQTMKIKKWFSDSGVTPNVLLQTEQLSTAKTIVASNLAVGFMFEKTVSTNKDIVPVPLKDPLFIDVSLVYKKDSLPLNSVTAFVSFIKKHNPFD